MTYIHTALWCGFESFKANQTHIDLLGLTIFFATLWLAWSHRSPLLLSLVLWNLLLDVKKCYTTALRHPATSCFLFGAVTFRAFVSPKGGRGQSGNRKVKYGYGDGQDYSLWATFVLSRNLWVSFMGSLFHIVRVYNRLDVTIEWKKNHTFLFSPALTFWSPSHLTDEKPTYISTQFLSQISRLSSSWCHLCRKKQLPEYFSSLFS